MLFPSRSARGASQRCRDSCNGSLRQVADNVGIVVGMRFAVCHRRGRTYSGAKIVIFSRMLQCCFIKKIIFAYINVSFVCLQRAFRRQRTDGVTQRSGDGPRAMQ